MHRKAIIGFLGTVLIFCSSYTVYALEPVELLPVYQEIVSSKSVEYAVPYETILAVMYKESRYIHDVVNYNNNGTADRGICQINTCHDDRLARLGLDVYNVEDNIEYACILLSELLLKYGDERVALAAYNAGEQGMLNGYGYSYADLVIGVKNEILEEYFIVESGE